MRILGVSCDYHDSAAALIVDGEIVAAVEEERLSRIKHDPALPVRSMASCLAIGAISPDEVDAIVFHEKPIGVASRVLAARQRRGLRSVGAFARDMPVLLKQNLMVGYRLENALREMGAAQPPRVQFCEHHLSHAAAAFYPSPFESAAVLTIDGIGEWSTVTLGHGLRGRIDLLEEQRYPNSLGLAYSLATMWCGFASNDGEYKLMGLAPFGTPTFDDALAEVFALQDDGSLVVDAAAVNWWAGDPAKMRRLVELFDGPPTPLGSEPTQRDADLARSIQELTEKAVLRMAQHAKERTGAYNLCLAGGVALNCVANGRVVREGPFDQVWVQPAAGDAGSAVGAALWYWHAELGNDRPTPIASSSGTPVRDAMSAAALGPRYGDDEVSIWLNGLDIEAERLATPDELVDQVAIALADGQVVGWFEGRSEFGPRALGHRSILADARSGTVQRDLNLRVKGRESFRPFAPAVLWEHAAEWFDIDRPSPYMLMTFQVAAAHLVPVAEEPSSFVDRVQVVRSEIPACTHIDGSARVQTVHLETNERFHRLLTAFHRLTGCPVLLNTSFNRAGEPIVCTPEDALATAQVAGIDLLVIGDHLIHCGAGREPAEQSEQVSA